MTEIQKDIISRTFGKYQQYTLTINTSLAVLGHVLNRPPDRSPQNYWHGPNYHQLKLKQHSRNLDIQIFITEMTHLHSMSRKYYTL